MPTLSPSIRNTRHTARRIWTAETGWSPVCSPLLEECGDGGLHVVDRDEIDVFGGNRSAVDVHVHPAVRRHPLYPRGARLELLQEFKDAVERKRLAYPAVASPSDDDPGTVDRERDARLPDEVLGLALALLVGVVEGGGMLLLLVDRPRLPPGHVGGGDVVEFVHVQPFGELDHAPRALVVHRVHASGGILAEVHVRRAVEDFPDALQQGVRRQLLHVDRGHVPLDHGHAGQHVLAGLRTSLERTFAADDLLRALGGRHAAGATHKAHKGDVAPFPGEGDDDGTSHQTGQAGEEDAVGQAAV